MLSENGKRFRRSLLGYNRDSVDAEFNRLVAQTERLTDEAAELRSKADAIAGERDSISREKSVLSTTVTTMTGQVLELETNLISTRSENESLQRTVEAQRAENNALQLRFDQLRIRDRDFALREREFAELQNSVSSIMSVTKRATDRLFQKAVDNQERVTRIAGDAAREVAVIRGDMSKVRDQLNATLDELQDRIDRVDASLTGAVHKLIAIKHDDGLRPGENQSDITAEVERLLSMRAGEVDFAGGKGYTVPVLGPYSAKFLSDTAARVGDGRIAEPEREPQTIDVHKAVPTPFESTDDSIVEANNLLERSGYTPEQYYAEPEQPAEPKAEPAIQIGFAAEPPQVIEMPPAPSAPFAVDSAAGVSAVSAQPGELTVGTHSFIPAPASAPVPEVRERTVAAVRPSRPRKVAVNAKRRRR